LPMGIPSEEGEIGRRRRFSSIGKKILWGERGRPATGNLWRKKYLRVARGEGSYLGGDYDVGKGERERRGNSPILPDGDSFGI